MRDTAPCAALMQTDEAFILLSPYARVAGLAPQQAQNTLLIGIGLRKHRSGRLFQYLGSCEVGCLQSVIRILNRSLGSQQIRRDVGEVAYRIAQTV